MIRFFLIIITLTFFGDSLAETVIEKNDAIAINESSDLSDDEKSMYLAQILSASLGFKNDSFITGLNPTEVMMLSERYLFKLSSNEQIKTLQISSVLGYVGYLSEPWILQRSRDQIADYLKDNISTGTGDFRNHNGLCGFLIELNRLSDAEQQCNLAYEDLQHESIIKLKVIYRKLLKYQLDSNFLYLHYKKGDIQYLSKEYKNLVQSFDFIVQTLSSDNDPLLTDLSSSLFGQTTLLHIIGFLGDYDQAEKFSAKLLYLSEHYADKSRYSHTYGVAKVLRLLSDVYIAKGDYKKSDQIFKVAFGMELKSQAISTEDLYRYLFKSLRSNDDQMVNMICESIELLITNAKYSETEKDWWLSLVQVARNSNKTSSLADSKERLAEIGRSFSFLLNEMPFIKTYNDFNYLLALKEAYAFNKIAGEYAFAAFFSKLYINKLQELRSDLDAKDSIDLFTSSKSEDLRDFALNFYKAGDPASALLTLRVLKENAYLEFIQTRSSNSLSLTKFDFNEDEKTTLKKVADIQLQLSSLNFAFIKEQDVESRRLLKTVIDEKNREIQSLLKALNSHVNSVAHPAKPESYGREQKSISSDKAMISYIVEKNTLSAMLSNKDGFQVFTKSIDRNELRVLVQKLVFSLQNKSLDNSVLGQLSEVLLIRDILDSMAYQPKTLVVRTDDLIGLVPISLLPYNANSLGNKFNIIYEGIGNQSFDDRGLVPAINVFGATDGSSTYSPLRYVKSEIEYIDNLAISTKSFKHSLYLNANFNKKNFFTSFANPNDYTHISTHFNPINPKLGLPELLLGDGSLLSVKEISENVAVSNSLFLVSLAGCDTGLNLSFNSSTDFEGLANIFSSKGAKYVLGTLWSVDDEATSHFMRLFYYLIIKHQLDPPDALRNAQSIFSSGSIDSHDTKASPLDEQFLASLNSRLSKYKNPYFWAGFQIVSN